jgi:hypothetical protein
MEGDVVKIKGDGRLWAVSCLKNTLAEIESIPPGEKKIVPASSLQVQSMEMLMRRYESVTQQTKGFAFAHLIIDREKEARKRYRRTAIDKGK